MSTNDAVHVAEFEKVSLSEYIRSKSNALTAYDETGNEAIEDALRKEWDAIVLPKRATSGSAGYDFYLPHDVSLGETPILIHTGVCCQMAPGWVLMLFPRSGLGFKYGVRLLNTVGIVDEDYYYADNEGHIAAKLCSSVPVCLKAGERFMQGVIVPYGTAFGDNCRESRHGGMGSTGMG